MVEYVILTLCLSMFIFFSIIFLMWSVKLKVSNICIELNQEFSWCSANILVEKNVLINNKHFLVNNLLIPKKQLAYACAVSMKTINFYINKNKFLGIRGNLKNATFVFLTDTSYNKFIGNSNSTTLLTKPNMLGKSTEICYIRAKFIPQVSTSGHLVVHEFLHCFLKATTGNSDLEHKTNTIVLEKGKNIEELCNNTTRVIIENKFRHKN